MHEQAKSGGVPDDTHVAYVYGRVNAKVFEIHSAPAIPRFTTMPSGTGIALQLPSGFEGQIRARSGLALHRGLTALNGPGAIDPGYRGEVSVILVNLSKKKSR